MPIPVVLHIGDAKAGSTALQGFLADRRGQLAEAVICYPVLSGYGEHEDLVAAYRGTRTDYRLAARLPRDGRDPRAHVRDTLARELAGYRGAILSGEHLAQLGEAELAALWADFAELGLAPVRAVFYAREPAGKFLSAVNQLVKRSPDLPDINRYRPGYADVLPPWAAALGPRLQVRAFAPQALVGGDICADFLAQAMPAFGLPAPAKAAGPRRNTALSAEAMVVLNRFHAHAPRPEGVHATPEARAYFDRLVATRLRRAPTKARPTETVRRLAYRNAAADLAYLWRQFGVDVSEGVPPADPAAAVAEPMDVAQLLAAYDPDLVTELGWAVQLRSLRDLLNWG